MATSQSLVQGQVNTLTGGLNTEATPLNFPFGFTVDELNCIVDRRGKRAVRTGVDLEPGGSLSSYNPSTLTPTVYSHMWKNVGGISDLRFQVVQVDDRVYFYDLSSEPIADGEKSFNINLNTYYITSAPAIAEGTIDVAYIGDKMVLVHPSCDPLLVSYNPDSDAITVSVITIKIRDFEWLGDESLYRKDETGTLTKERQYDSYNSGWDYPADGDFSDDTPALSNTHITTYFTATSQYPRLTLPWFAAKDATGDFDVTAWKKLNDQSSLSGNGRYILEAFNKDRTAVSGIASITAVTTVNRPSSVRVFQGRVFYSGIEGIYSNVVYFTKIIETSNDYGTCYQVNDPTSELTPDLVASDGGVIQIDEARNIRHMFSLQDKLIIFAENGVWFVSGRDGVFRAGDFFVSRVTDVGMNNRKSFVDVDGTPMWWSQTGIHFITSEPGTNQFSEQNLALTTIQTLIDKIESREKKSVQGVFDDVNKKIYWIYQDKNERAYRNILSFDTQLQAWAPLKIAEDQNDMTSIVGVFFDNRFQTNDVFSGSTLSPLIKFWVGREDSGSNHIAVAQFTRDSYVDWGEFTYSAYLESNFEFSGDLTTRKTNQTVTVMIENIEDSSCIMKSFWEFRSDLNSKQEVFRPSRFLKINDSPVVTRNRIRGRGRVLTLRFEATPGKGFTLVGFETWNNKNAPV